MSSFLERFQNKTSTIGKMGDIQLDSTKVINNRQTSPSPAMQQKSTIMSGGSTIVSNFGRFNQTATTSFARPIRLQSNNSVYSSYDQSLLLKDTQSENLQTTALATETVKGVKPEVEQQQISIYKEPELRNTTIQNIPEAKRTLTAVVTKKPPVPRRPKVAKSVSTPLKQIIEEEKPTKPLPRRQVDYKPYTLAEYKAKQLNQPVQLGGLGAYNIGTKEWSSAKTLYDKRKSYAREVQSNNNTRMANSPPVARPIEPEFSNAYILRQRALEFAKGIQRPKLKAPRRVSWDGMQEEDPLAQRKFLEEEHGKYLSTLEELKAKMDLC